MTTNVATENNNLRINYLDAKHAYLFEKIIILIRIIYVYHGKYYL